jgi:hypothetical protein
MTTDYEDLSITSLPLASDKDFVALVTSFSVDPDSPDLSFLQRDGATAVIDLATEFEKYGVASNPDLIARVIGRLSDIQVRDFALGTHNSESFETYWLMWHYLLQIAPKGFVAPVATLFATLAYERSDTPLAYRSLDRASADAPGVESLVQAGPLMLLLPCALNYIPRSPLGFLSKPEPLLYFPQVTSSSV